MNLKDQKNYIKFLMKISGLLGIPENHIGCDMSQKDITFNLYKNNQMKDIVYVLHIIDTPLEMFSIHKEVIITKKSNHFWESKKVVELPLFRFTKNSEAEFYDSNDNLYEFNKITLFNLSMDRDMVFTYDIYRKLFLEFKKLKSTTFKIVCK